MGAKKQAKDTSIESTTSGKKDFMDL